MNNKLDSKWKIENQEAGYKVLRVGLECQMEGWDKVNQIWWYSLIIRIVARRKDQHRK